MLLINNKLIIIQLKLFWHDSTSLFQVNYHSSSSIYTVSGCMISHVGSHTADSFSEYYVTGFLLHCEYNPGRSAQVSSFLASSIHSAQAPNTDPPWGVYLSTVPSDYYDLYPLFLAYANCYYKKPAEIITSMLRISYPWICSSSVQRRLLTWQKGNKDRWEMGCGSWRMREKASLPTQSWYFLGSESICPAGFLSDQAMCSFNLLSSITSSQQHEHARVILTLFFQWSTKHLRTQNMTPV